MTQMSRNPGTSGLIGAANPKQLNTAVLPVVFSLLAEAGIPYVHGCKPPWPHREEASYVGTLSLANGSSAYCRSMHSSGVDANVRGLNLAWIFIDEARDIERKALDVAIAALRGHEEASYQVRITTTPAGYDWVYDSFASEDSKLPGSELIRGRTSDNAPNLPKGFEDRLRGSYSKDMAAQEIDGEFVQSNTNMVFRFDRKIHVKPCGIIPSLPILLSADQNVEHYSALVMQVDEKNERAWVLDEIRIEDDATTRECAAEFADKYRECKRVEFWCDPTSIKRDTRGGASDMEIMEQSLEMFLPNCNVREGSDRALRPVIDEVNAVNSLLDPAKGEPRLLIDPKCEYLIRDMERCKYIKGERKMDKKGDLSLTHMADALMQLTGQLLPVWRGECVGVGEV